MWAAERREDWWLLRALPMPAETESIVCMSPPVAVLGSDRSPESGVAVRGSEPSSHACLKWMRSSFATGEGGMMSVIVSTARGVWHGVDARLEARLEARLDLAESPLSDDLCFFFPLSRCFRAIASSIEAREARIVPAFFLRLCWYITLTQTAHKGMQHNRQMQEPSTMSSNGATFVPSSSD